MPPEKSAYALARYSRSPDSIRDSIEWVRTHDSREIPGELLLPVRPRLHRRPGPHRDVLRRHHRAGGHRDRRRAAVGRAGEIVALPGFFALRLHHAAGTLRRSRRGVSGRRRGAAGGLRQGEGAGIRRLVRAPAAPRGHEAGRVPAQPRGARLRCRALPALLGRSDQCRTGDQHTHPGEADPPAEGFRVRGAAQPGRRNRAGLRRAARLRLGRQRHSRAAGAHPGAPCRCRPARRADRATTCRLWAAQNLPARAGHEADRVDLRPPHQRPGRYRGDAALPGHRPPVPRAVRAGLRVERAAARRSDRRGAAIAHAARRDSGGFPRRACTPTIS